MLYSSLLKECGEQLGNKENCVYADSRCRIYSLRSKEISIYSNGDLFIRPKDSENSSEVEIKKARFTYNPKYQDPLLNKSPFSNRRSGTTTPNNESLIPEPHNQVCRWKFGSKEDLEASNRLEHMFKNLKEM